MRSAAAPSSPPGRVARRADAAEWQKLLHFNLTGTFLFTHAVIPVMSGRARQDRQPRVDRRARGQPGERRAYATAKGGIIALTRKLSLELGPTGSPSMPSPQPRPCPSGSGPTGSAVGRSRAPNRAHPAGAGGDPEDQARVICFLASSDADFVTGVTIDVTGGQ